MHKNEIQMFGLEDLPPSIDEASLKQLLLSKIQITSVILSKSTNTAVVTYSQKDIPDISILDELENITIPNTSSKLKLVYTKHTNNSNTSSSVLTHNIQSKDFIPGSVIQYNFDYTKHIIEYFIRKPGDEGLIFIDNATIEKQRSVIKHFITKIGSNILSGSGIMNVSLPVNIFDQRSLLEVFAHQCRIAPFFLERAGNEDDPIEKLKHVTAFAIARVHLSVTQLKPFNPIWGETFQCSIGNTSLYIEQSSHHPPIYNFLHIGKAFKSYGYQQPEASTMPNSIYARTLGIYNVVYKDGTEHIVYPCELQMEGTMIGERTYALVNKFYVVDKGNDLIAYVEFNPDKRGVVEKLFKKKETMPDYFKGCITRLSQCEYDKEKNSFKVKENYTPLVKIEGEWSSFCLFDGDEYWRYENTVYEELRRMEFTLQSDSTIREDCLYLKEGDEEKAALAKVEMEEIQRRDRRLREKYRNKK